ncbi:MAG: ABC transporter substrate-binding protein, partial [Xanthobacteraceae bacterium]
AHCSDPGIAGPAEYLHRAVAESRLSPRVLTRPRPMSDIGRPILLQCEAQVPTRDVIEWLGLRTKIVRRRDFIALAGGAAAAWPLAAGAQQSAMPIIGFFSSQSPVTYAPFPAAFRQGLKESGFVDGENVTIEYRWARGHVDQLSALAADLVQRQVNVIAATGGVASALAAKAATKTIPIVFNSGEDPVQAGLVSSLNRPGGNVTGVSWFNDELVAKRLSLLHQLVPAAAVIGILANPRDPELPPQLTAAKVAAHSLGLKLVVINATSPADIEAGFAALVQQGAGAMIVAAGPFFVNQRSQIIALAAQHTIPCIYSGRESPAAGGLISYGNVLTDAYRRNGIYVARILKGDKPADLPIDRSTKFELVINLKTAKALDITVPPTLLALADEVMD